jgi:hypothetical protein
MCRRHVEVSREQNNDFISQFVKFIKVSYWQVIH